MEDRNRHVQIRGVAACYTTEEDVLDSVRQAVANGYTALDVYSPFPLDEVSEILNHRERRVPWCVFTGGVTGGVGGFMMQYIANVRHLPLNIGGRPYNSWPAFIPITFEFTILFAALSGLLAFILVCGFPRLHHPVFDVSGFEKATLDRFFLCIFAEDKRFQLTEVSRFLHNTKAEDVQIIES